MASFFTKAVKFVKKEAVPILAVGAGIATAGVGGGIVAGIGSALKHGAQSAVGVAASTLATSAANAATTFEKTAADKQAEAANEAAKAAGKSSIVQTFVSSATQKYLVIGGVAVVVLLVAMWALTRRRD